MYISSNEVEHSYYNVIISEIQQANNHTTPVVVIHAEEEFFGRSPFILFYMMSVTQACQDLVSDTFRYLYVIHSG